MKHIKPTFLSILFFLPTFLIEATTSYAHGGRTDASGCHTNHSTGEYHCHNGSSSSSSSSYVKYRYKDNDRNGINDFKQDWNELSKNLKSIGDEDGVEDAEWGSYDPEGNIYEFSNKEYEWYKQGYVEGYNRKSLMLLEEEANDEGYQLGISTDTKSIPTKFAEAKHIQEIYDQAFEKGQKERWSKLAEEAATKFVSFSIPEELPPSVRQSAQESYDSTIELEKKQAYEIGYKNAFYNDTLIVPEQYEKTPLMKAQFEKGFKDNTEITTYKKQAYDAGKKGEEYLAPQEVSDDHAETLYERYYEKGKRDRLISIAKWTGIVLMILAIVFIPVVYFNKKKKRL